VVTSIITALTKIKENGEIYYAYLLEEDENVPPNMKMGRQYWNCIDLS